MRMFWLVIPTLLTSCASLSAMTGAATSSGHVDALKVIGEHMEGCDRHYQGSLGLGGNFTFNIDCRAREETQSR